MKRRIDFSLFKRSILQLSFLLFLSIPIQAQFRNATYPIIKNFERSEYNASMQIWNVSQAPNDLMYFANNYGILEFDGHNWELYGINNYTIVRSVLAADDEKIYVGLSNDFGYFVSDSTGQYRFYSKLNLLPPDKRNIEGIWRIHKTSYGVVYQTFNELFVLKDEKVSVYPAPLEFYLSFYINNKLYVVDWQEGILEFKNGEFKVLIEGDRLPNSEICAIMPYGKDLMIATTGKGVFLYRDKELTEWQTPSTKFLLENQIYSAIRVDENRIAFGTIQKGLLICDNEGEPILQVDQTSGLQNNTILSMSLDRSGNLWLGTNNGIDLLYINSPISHLGVDQGYGSGYTAVVHNNILYLGTNQGLYYKNLSNASADFKLIKRLKGQVWTLKVIDGVLFCGHNKGSYIVEGDKVEKLGTSYGGWMFLKSEKYPNRIIGGSYNGLILFEKENGKWAFKKKIGGFKESSRMMFFDKDETIWMSHGFKGVFHLTLNEEYDSVVVNKFYNSEKGFKTDYGINIAKLQDQLLFLSTEGAFEYNAQSDSILPSEYFNNFFSNQKVNYALEDIYGNIWYYSDHSLGAKLIRKDGTYEDVTMPFKQLKDSFIEGFQFVYPGDENNFLISYENGFINYNAEKDNGQEDLFNLYLNKVILSKSDSILFKGHQFKDNASSFADIDYKNNSIQFYYSAVHFEAPQEVEFSTYLEGYDESWTSWKRSYQREFTNLEEGKYAFRIKARNIHNIETPPLVYYFEIQPPWSRTTQAYLLYAFAAALMAFMVFYAVRKRIHYLKKREEKLQKQKYIEREKELQNEALVAEKEIIRLRNEQLRDKLKTKNKELANSTMETINKNEFLISLKQDMQKNNSEMISDTAKRQNQRLIRKIDTKINNENDWKVFETYFNNVHEEFLSKIKQQYPQISPAELRLCACLRMNISSKEIASLLNISIRGVEASRYRLRKALQLDRKTNLTDFILSL